MKAGDHRKPSSGGIQKHERDQRHDAKRRVEKQSRGWYKSKLWLARREEQLSSEPLCRRCKARGRIAAANTANHIIPNKENWTLFATGELESLCEACHNSPVQREEARGYPIGCDASGRPIDPSHPWNLTPRT